MSAFRILSSRDGAVVALSHVITALLYQTATSWRTVFSVIFCKESCNASSRHHLSVWNMNGSSWTVFRGLIPGGLRRGRGSLEKSVEQRRFSSGEPGNFASQWPASIVKNVFACINALILLRSSRLSLSTSVLLRGELQRGLFSRIHVKLKTEESCMRGLLLYARFKFLKRDGENIHVNRHESKLENEAGLSHIEINFIPDCRYLHFYEWQ